MVFNTDLVFLVHMVNKLVKFVNESNAITKQELYTMIDDEVGKLRAKGKIRGQLLLIINDERLYQRLREDIFYTAWESVI